MMERKGREKPGGKGIGNGVEKGTKQKLRKTGNWGKKGGKA